MSGTSTLGNPSKINHALPFPSRTMSINSNKSLNLLFTAVEMLLKVSLVQSNWLAAGAVRLIDPQERWSLKVMLKGSPRSAQYKHITSLGRLDPRTSGMLENGEVWAAARPAPATGQGGHTEAASRARPLHGVEPNPHQDGACGPGARWT